MADLQKLADTRYAYDDKRVVVGLYGIPGSGKATLLEHFKEELGQDGSAFYDGSEVISGVFQGRLEAFHGLYEEEKNHWRVQAIKKTEEDYTKNKKVGVVAGHFMFWEESQKEGKKVWTQQDLSKYTHIVYLDEKAGDIANRRRNDRARDRPSASSNHLHNWRSAEKRRLQALCIQISILFMRIFSPAPPLTLSSKASILLHNFKCHTKEHNLLKAEERLDGCLTVQS